VPLSVCGTALPLVGLNIGVDFSAAVLLLGFEVTLVRIGTNRLRAGLTIGLIIVIGLAAYPIGRQLWGQHHRRGLEVALFKRDFELAERELAKCLSIWPASADLKLVSARLARRQGNLAEAAWRLKQCPRQPGVHENVLLEECLLEIQRGEFGSSAQLEEYCGSFPGTSETMLIDEALIVGSLAALDLARANKHLAAWNERHKSPVDRVQGLLWQATAALLAQNVDDAARCFREAVKVAPNHRQARLGLAQVLADSDPAEAAEHLKLIASHGAGDAEVQFCQAVVARNMGQADAAAKLLDEIIAGNAENVPALVFRGRLALDERDFEKAATWFRRAEAVEPKHRDVLVALVEYYRLTGQSAQAEQYQQRIERLKGEVIQHVQSVRKERERSASGASEQP